MALHPQIARHRHVLLAVLPLARQYEVGLRNPLEHDARRLDEVGDSLLRDHPTGLRHHRRARRDAMAQAERGSIPVGSRQIDAVIDARNAPGADQIAAQHAVHVVVADAEHPIQREIQRARRQALPGRPARGDIAFGMRALVGKEDLIHAAAARHPWVRTEKAGEIEVEDVGGMALQDGGEMARRPRRESPGILKHIESDIGQLEEFPHLTLGKELVAEHAFPAVPCEARGERAGKHLSAADPRGIDSEDGDHPSRWFHTQAGIGAGAGRGPRAPTRLISGLPQASRRACISGDGFCATST